MEREGNLVVWLKKALDKLKNISDVYSCLMSTKKGLRDVLAHTTLEHEIDDMLTTFNFNSTDRILNQFKNVKPGQIEIPFKVDEILALQMHISNFNERCDDLAVKNTNLLKQLNYTRSCLENMEGHFIVKSLRRLGCLKRKQNGHID